jgi:hypothetical protein
MKIILDKAQKDFLEGKTIAHVRDLGDVLQIKLDDGSILVFRMSYDEKLERPVAAAFLNGEKIWTS